MRRPMRLATWGLGLLSALLAASQAGALEHGRIQRVLLLSIDGMHALDVANYVAAHPGSALATLVKPGHFADLVCKISDCTAIEAARIITTAGNDCPQGPCGYVQDDDIALIWLPDQSKTRLVTDYLNQNAAALYIDEVMAGEELKLKFRDPLQDSRTPDIIVQPIYGTIYTGASKNKVAEHGGFSFGDTNVGLIVSNPSLGRRVVRTPVLSSQVAATILRALDIDPNELQAVRQEGIQPLPFL